MPSGVYVKTKEHKEKLRQAGLGPKNHKWKGGRHVHSDGYVYVYKPDHPHPIDRYYVLEHRLVMEQYLGRYLRSDEHIHHINKNRQDNRIENLQILTQSQHSELENIIDMTDRVCSICKKHKTYIDPRDGRPDWLYIKNELVCKTCYTREKRRGHI